MIYDFFIRKYRQICLRHVPLKNIPSVLRKMGVQIGNACEIQRNISWGSEPYLISIGNHVRVTEGCKFITHDGGTWILRELYKRPYVRFGGIIIGNNVHIGMNSIIMPGVHIGDNVVIGCGAVVTKNIPSNEVWGGYPQKRLRM